jgi:hypothetical protein
MKLLINIINKQKYPKRNHKGQEGKTSLIWGLVPVEGGRNREKVKEG